jgi:transposase
VKIGHPTTIGWVITVLDWAQIRYLHGSEGMSIRAIAARLGLSRDTVSTSLVLAASVEWRQHAAPPG